FGHVLLRARAVFVFESDSRSRSDVRETHRYLLLAGVNQHHAKRRDDKESERALDQVSQRHSLPAMRQFDEPSWHIRGRRLSPGNPPPEHRPHPATAGWSNGSPPCFFIGGLPPGAPLSCRRPSRPTERTNPPPQPPLSRLARDGKRGRGKPE